jgi:hypothetical protein
VAAKPNLSVMVVPPMWLPPLLAGETNVQCYINIVPSWVEGVAAIVAMVKQGERRNLGKRSHEYSTTTRSKKHKQEEATHIVAARGKGTLISLFCNCPPMFQRHDVEQQYSILI